MKLLVFQSDTFTYRVEQRTSELGDEVVEPSEVQTSNALIAFAHCEPRDADRMEALLKQAVKYFEWLFRKRRTSSLVLHSFAHLDEERASPEVAKRLLGELAGRLRERNYDVAETPFGWSLSWTLSTAGHPYAKTFKVL